MVLDTQVLDLHEVLPLRRKTVAGPCIPKACAAAPSGSTTARTPEAHMELTCTASGPPAGPYHALAGTSSYAGGVGQEREDC
eukprot:12899476-Prorocentrum_lima.AAC.1